MCLITIVVVVLVTILWNGKAHALKEEGMFVNLAEGLFFWEDLAGKQG